MDIMAYSSTTPEQAIAPVKRMSFDRAIRKIFPSTSKLEVCHAGTSFTVPPGNAMVPP